MLTRRVRQITAVAALASCLSLVTRSADAGQAPNAPNTPARGAARVAVPQTVRQVAAEDPNAEETRQQLMQLLEKYPPSLARVLKLDPSLLGNDEYLAPYPALAAFLDLHPGVRHNPAFFLERVNIAMMDQPRASDASRIWQSMVDWFGGVSIAAIIVTTIAWLIRTFVDYRRWYRLSKVQSEAHHKLLDRLTSNEELLAYLQSTAGSRFLESAPIMLDAGARTLSAPVSRIMWSVQVGLVLAAGGLGMQYVSRSVEGVSAQPVLALGILGVALGIGFVGSAIVSYVISRRLGLVTAPATSKETGHA
jgi:hypothetical protein